MVEYIEKPDVQYILHIKSDKKVEKRLIDYCLESVVDVFEDTGLTVDVQPVKHGWWTERAYDRKQCTYCGKCEDTATDFCPNCGARMDGDK